MKKVTLLLAVLCLLLSNIANAQESIQWISSCDGNENNNNYIPTGDRNVLAYFYAPWEADEEREVFGVIDYGALYISLGFFYGGVNQLEMSYPYGDDIYPGPHWGDYFVRLSLDQTNPDFPDSEDMLIRTEPDPNIEIQTTVEGLGDGEFNITVTASSSIDSVVAGYPGWGHYLENPCKNWKTFMYIWPFGDNNNLGLDSMEYIPGQSIVFTTQGAYNGPPGEICPRASIKIVDTTDNLWFSPINISTTNGPCTFVGDTNVGQEEISNEPTFRVFPNPVQAGQPVTITGQFQRLKLIGLSGQEVPIARDWNQITLNVSPGLYFLSNINDEDGTSTTCRIIVTN